MESYVASVVSDVLKKRREMDELEAKAQERKLVRMDQQLSVTRERMFPDWIMKMALRPTFLHNNKAIVFSKVSFKNFCTAKKLY